MSASDEFRELKRQRAAARKRLALEVEVVLNPKVVTTIPPIEVRRFRAHPQPDHPALMDHAGYATQNPGTGDPEEG